MTRNETTATGERTAAREWTRSEVILNAWIDRAVELIDAHIITRFIGPTAKREEAVE